MSIVKYPLTLSRNYVASWGLAEAVRELIQNALDSERPFEYAFEPDGDETTALSIHSAGVVLGPSTLLLGVTSKTGTDDAIGSFGEGFKIALLVLTRLCKTVVIRNGDVDWRPAFEHSTLYHEQMLVINELPAVRPSKDLIFEIYGLTGDEVEAVKASCLLMQHGYGEKKSTSYGEILLERPGELYVGNLFVCKTEMKYGYNVGPQYLKLDRDRQTVSSYTLSDITMNMWEQTKQYDLMAEMIDNEVIDMQSSRWNASEGLQKACYERFRLQHPNALVASSQSEMDALGKVAPSVVRVNAGMYNAISSYSVYSTDRSLVKIETPTERLEKFLKDNSELFYYDELTTKFQVLIEESADWSIE